MELPPRLSFKTVHFISATLAQQWAEYAPECAVPCRSAEDAKYLYAMTRDFYDALLKNLAHVERDQAQGVSPEDEQDPADLDDELFYDDAPPNTFSRWDYLKAAIGGRMDPYSELLHKHARKKKAELTAKKLAE